MHSEEALPVCLKPPYLMFFTGESATGIDKKPLSTPATPQRQYKKFSFEGRIWAGTVVGIQLSQLDSHL